MPVMKSARFGNVQGTVALSAGCLAVLVGCLVLVGWALDLSALKGFLRGGGGAMKVNTAVCCLLGGVSLLAWRGYGERTSERARSAWWLAMVAAALLTAVAAVTWSQYLFQWNSGLDELLFRVPVATGLASPGRMSEASSICFCLVGVALLLLGGGDRNVSLMQILAAVASALALLILLSYVYGADMRRIGSFPAAPDTAVTLLALCVGMLAVRGDRGWVNAFLQDTSSAKLGRKMLVGTVLALPLIGEIRIVGQRNLDLYDTYFGIAILIVSSICVLTLLNWLGTRSGNEADRKVDKLLRVNATLSGINTLIVRVQEKSLLYEQACQVAGTTGRFPWVWIATREPGEPHVELRAMHGGNADLERMLRARMDDMKAGEARESWTARAMRTQEPVVINDLGADSADWDTSSVRIHPVLLAHGIRSFVMLPLVVAGTSVGVVTLHAELVDFFDVAELALLRELAGDIAFAILHIEKSQTLNYLSHYDALTGLPNRALFEERLNRELQTAARSQQRVIVMVGDLKRFRMINESMGRTTGDEVLRQYARRLRQSMRFPDNLARLGADTFASFLPDYDLADGNRIQASLEASTQGPFVMHGQSLTLQTSVGAAVYPEDGSNVETLMRNAENALKQAKGHGDAFRFYEAQMNARVAESLALEHKLRKALDLGQFVLHYQPKVDLVRRAIHGVEALIRWNDPETGMVPPGRFIPLLEEIGLIREVGDWAMRRAVADACRWRDMGLQAPRCAVNVSAIQLREKNFSATVFKAIEGFGDEECLLDIEITESLLMENVAQTTLALKGILAAGLEISVDDFGTGFSSLAYLARLPISTLKIDRAFIIDLETDDNSRSIVASIISLAHALNLNVVAEGVETEGQASILRNLDCDLMQGFLFSKAVPFEVLATMLQPVTRLNGATASVQQS